MNKPSLFLTGGTGFFGRSLLRHLIKLSEEGQNPYQVTVMTRSPEKFLEMYPEFLCIPWLDFFKGDILGGADAFPQDSYYSHIIHAAADSTNGPQLALLDRFDQIVTGTRNVLEFAAKIGVSRFLLTSSGGVYGAQPSEIESIYENYNGMPNPLDAANAYSVAKRQAEHLGALYASKAGFEFVVARCFAFVGPDLPLNAHFAIGNFIQDAVAGRDITVNGDGTPIRSYLYQDDLAHWLLTILQQGRAGEAYNVGSDEQIAIGSLAEMVRDMLAPARSVFILKAKGADCAIRNRYVPSILKARTDLGLLVRVSLEKAINLTAKCVINQHSDL